MYGAGDRGQKSKPRTLKKKGPKPVKGAAQQYVSQGKAVEKAANQQKAVRARRAAAQPYVSQGRAVEKAANQQKKDRATKFFSVETGKRIKNPEPSVPVSEQIRRIWRISPASSRIQAKDGGPSRPRSRRRSPPT